MRPTYHPGEQDVQTQAGVRDQAARTGGMLRDTIVLAAQAFIALQPIVFLAAAAVGRVWASALSGPPGFAHALDERSLRLDSLPSAADPITPGLLSGAEIGLLAIDPSTRRRMRVNGTIRSRNDTGFTIETAQVYANCPKYIQARELEPTGAAEDTMSPPIQRSAVLTPAQTRWIATADTFVIATTHPDGGADASHRGGLPGFVRVDAPDALVFPDYTGNMMFQTLGNLAVDPRAGLLFLDFTSGAILQLSGRAIVDWNPATAATFPGAQRAVAFTVDAVVETSHAIPLRWRFASYSPFNPRERQARPRA